MWLLTPLRVPTLPRVNPSGSAQAFVVWRAVSSVLVVLRSDGLVAVANQAAVRTALAVAFQLARGGYGTDASVAEAQALITAAGADAAASDPHDNLVA